MKRPVFCVLLGMLALGCYSDKGLSPPGNNPGIQGKITFLNAWPDSTRLVMTVAMKHYPAGITDDDSLLAFITDAFYSGGLAYSEPIPPGSENYNYRMPLEPGLYEWILVVWFPDIEDYFFGVKELGAYYKDKEIDLPTPVEVRPGVMMEGIDIIADMNNVYRDTHFFKSGRGS